MTSVEVEKIVQSIRQLTGGEITVDPNSVPDCVNIAAVDVVSVMTYLHEDPSLYFDMLSCVTGVDNGPAAGTVEVIYHVYSIPFDRSLSVKTVVERSHPEVDSVTSIWKSANWLEREVYDMFGIHFNNHPDLRRILMPNDWEGFPLRKDYQHQDSYREIKVKY